VIPSHIQKEIIHYTEMNDKVNDRISIIDIDIDMNVNVWDIARNLIQPISFHLFQGQSNSTMYIYI
jgi:hypothetical protein